MVTVDRYAFLDNMRAIAIVMVVAIHAMAFSADIPADLRGRILIVIVTIAVPVFFFIDGYLLAVSHALGKHVPYWAFIKKSSYRLLLPWFMFTLAYCVLRYVFEYFNMLDTRHVLGRDISYIISALYGSVYAGQMYFLVSLFFIRLMAPLISFIFNSSPIIIAISACIIFIVFHENVRDEIYEALYIPGGQEPLTHAIWGLQYYIVGILAFRVTSLIDVKSLLLPCGSIFIASYFYSIYEVFQLAFLVFFFVFLKRFSFENRLVSYVGSNTMGIYLLHSPLILKMTSICVLHFISGSLVAFLLNASITTVLTIFSVYLFGRVGLSPYLFGEPKKKVAYAKVPIKAQN